MSKFNRMVAERMAATGEKWQQAQEWVRAQEDVRILPQFEQRTFAKRRLGQGTDTDPVHALGFEVAHGTRRSRLTVIPKAEGTTEWSCVVLEEEGSWPLAENERAALETWLDQFAASAWPNRKRQGSFAYHGKPPTDWPGRERDEALRAIYSTHADEQPIRKGRALVSMRSGTSQAALLQWVHIEGTRFGNTTWSLSGTATGAKLHLVLPEPITRQVVEDAFHLEACPLAVETSPDGGSSWVYQPSESNQWDWEATLRRASSFLEEGGWNAVRVCSHKWVELVRYHEPDLAQVALYDREAQIVLAGLMAHVGGVASEIERTGPEVPSARLTFDVPSVPCVVHIALMNGAIFCRATTQTGEMLWRADRHPLNEAGARAAAAEVVRRLSSNQ